MTPLALEGLVLALGAEFARIVEPEPGPALLAVAAARARRSRRRLPDAGHACRALAAGRGGASVYTWQPLSATPSETSVGEYVRARRLEAARVALYATPTVPSARSPSPSGFSSQSHFTQAFRRQSGLTPGAYRRQQDRA